MIMGGRGSSSGRAGGGGGSGIKVKKQSSNVTQANNNTGNNYQYNAGIPRKTTNPQPGQMLQTQGTKFNNNRNITDGWTLISGNGTTVSSRKTTVNLRGESVTITRVQSKATHVVIEATYPTWDKAAKKVTTARVKKEFPIGTKFPIK